MWLWRMPENGLPKVQRGNGFAKSLRQKDRVKRLHDGESGCCSLFDFVFSEPEPFVGLAFFFVCTDEKGLERS